MHTDQNYIHYQEAITSLNRAWRTLRELEVAKPGTAMWSAAYRMSLIEYCKPFKVSYGSNKEKLSLPAPDLDQEMLKLHKAIIDLRDAMLVHSDISVMDAKVSYNHSSKFPVPLIVSKTVTNLPKVADIRALVERVLDKLYMEQEKYDQHYSSSP